MEQKQVSPPEEFNRTMRKILSISKQELNRRIEAEKQAKASSASHVPAVASK